jgi:hypothetical protein
MAKYKLELNKKISTIINGFLISKNSDIEHLPSEFEKETPANISAQQSMPQQPLSSPSAPPQQTANLPAGAVVSKPSPAAGSVVKPSGQISQCQNSKQIKNQLSFENAAEARKNKKMAIVMGTLLLVFIFVIIRATQQLSPSTAGAGNLADANAGSQTVVTIKNINWKIPEVYPSSLRDPMQINSTAIGQEKGGSLIVKGIISSENRPSAVVNDKIVHQGDKVSEATVVKINKSNVEFEMDGKNWTQEVQR